MPRTLTLNIESKISAVIASIGPNWAPPAFRNRPSSLSVFFADRVAEAAGGVDRAGIRRDDGGRGAEGLLGGGERLRVAARDDDPGAFALQELGGRQADAGRAARDEYGLVFHAEFVL